MSQQRYTQKFVESLFQKDIAAAKAAKERFESGNESSVRIDSGRYVMYSSEKYCWIERGYDGDWKLSESRSPSSGREWVSVYTMKKYAVQDVVIEQRKARKRMGIFNPRHSTKTTAGSNSRTLTFHGDEKHQALHIEFQPKVDAHMSEEDMQFYVERILTHALRLWDIDENSNPIIRVKFMGRSVTGNNGTYRYFRCNENGTPEHTIIINPFWKRRRGMDQQWMLNRNKITHVIDHEFGHAHNYACDTWKKYDLESYADSYALAHDEANRNFVKCRNAFVPFELFEDFASEPEWWDEGVRFMDAENVACTKAKRTMVNPKSVYSDKI